jgi:hypothetical protein
MSADLFADLKTLTDAWCDRRALRALREFLPGYLALNGLTDGWGHLEDALKDVLLNAEDEITVEESKEVKRLMIAVQHIIHSPR